VNRGAYGKNLSDLFGLAAAPSFISRSLHPSTAAVTQIVCDIENNGLTAPLAREEAFLITLQLRNCPAHSLWIDGRAMPTGPLVPGSVSLYDLRTDPRVKSVSPFRNMHFYFSRGALQAAAEGADISSMDSMAHNPGLGVLDGVLYGLGRSLLPAFERPAEVTALFVDHITTAVAAHVVRVFGRACDVSVPAGLAPWQETRAKELLTACLDGAVPIAKLARECGLPTAVFSAAFEASTGRLPHRWLLEHRIARARRLLRLKRPSAEVAQVCGFASEEHLRRVLEYAKTR
jgi:AraC family transcriptional regulator